MPLKKTPEDAASFDTSKESLNNLKQQANKQIQERPINISINQKFDKSALVALGSSVVL